MAIACRDCRYVTGHGDNARCEHPQSFTELMDYYSGRFQTVTRSVHFMRMLGECEEDAKLFERRLDLADG